MEFTIYRKSWRRGGDSQDSDGDTCLLNGQNRFCCLGFCAIQLGVEPKALYEKGQPSDISPEFIPKEPLVLWKQDRHNSALSEKAIKVNDASVFTDEEREKTLTKIFASRGHTLKFVNRLAPKAWRVAE